ncbi:MAG: DMT family transporter [bacterium]
MYKEYINVNYNIKEVFFIFGYSTLFLGAAALAGIMMAFQGTINSALGKKIGLTETTLIVHATASLILVLVLIFKKNNLDFKTLKSVPWYLYAGGAMGIIITYGVAMSIPKLGVAVATTGIITAQILSASLIDHLGILGVEQVSFTWLRLGGILLMALGVRMLLHQ